MAKKHSLGRMLVFGAITGALGGIAAYKHRKAIERTLQDIADQMDAWEDDGDFFHDDDTVVHTMPSASREEASAEAPAEAEPEDQIQRLCHPGDGRINAAVRKKPPLPRF